MWLYLAPGALLVAACGKPADAPSAPPSTPPSAAAPAATLPASAAVPSAWLGRWLGPEGTYLDIAQDGAGYALTLANLDGPRPFRGQWQGDALVFERDGQREAIRPGNGDDTGMKWLAGKANCLVVKPGEGYCRD